MMNGTAPLEERLDFLDRCTRCSQCKFVPTPRSQKHASACPSMDFVEYHAGSASGQLIMASGIAHGEFGYSPGLLDAMSAAGIEFKDLSTTQSSLEDIFVSLVREPRA